MTVDVNPEIAAAGETGRTGRGSRRRCAGRAGVDRQGSGAGTHHSGEHPELCWCQLPVKWLISLTDKLRVAGALAQELDLLQLPQDAAICRSGTTREILSAYEISTAHGRAAFRQAESDQGTLCELPGGRLHSSRCGRPSTTVTRTMMPATGSQAELVAVHLVSPVGAPVDGYRDDVAALPRVGENATFWLPNSRASTVEILKAVPFAGS